MIQGRSFLNELGLDRRSDDRLLWLDVYLSEFAADILYTAVLGDVGHGLFIDCLRYEAARSTRSGKQPLVGLRDVHWRCHRGICQRRLQMRACDSRELSRLSARLCLDCIEVGAASLTTTAAAKLLHKYCSLNPHLFVVELARRTVDRHETIPG